jgi:DNA-binding SARP family transcriptional activator
MLPTVPMELALLGRPVVTVGGERVDVPTRKALALVSYLAVEGAAPRARLADALWPSVGPDSARGNLRRELNRLRHTPVGPELVNEGDAITLREPFTCDVRQFGGLVEAKDFAGALALYRGPLLDGFELCDADGFDDWLARRRAALAERHRSVLVLKATSLEEAGDPRGALQAYLDLIRLDETQESYHRAAMRLHHLLGEREAALERFARLKRVLARELALEPLPETLELYRAIRSAKVEKSATTTARHSIALHPPLVGRASQWSVLKASAAPLVVLLAEAGAGKTRLAEDFARSTGSYIVARASELSQSTPLHPFASALQDALEHREMSQRIRDLKPAWRREASRLVPGIDPDAAVDSVPEEARSRFLEGLARALAAAVGPRGVLVLDDLQWFDGASVELALQLVRRARALDVRLLATARPLELETSPAARLVSSVARDGLSETLELDALSAADVSTLVGAMSKSTDLAPFAAWLHGATGGNPLYVLETLKSLVASGTLFIGDSGWDARDYDELPLPRGVRDVVLAQVERLGAAVRRLVDAASLAGNAFTLDDLLGATGLGDFEAVDALERAVDAGLLVRGVQGASFVHEHVRRALADDLSAERRKLLHERLAESIVRRGGAAARAADHFTRAGRSADALAFRIRAAEDALRVFAYREALAQYQAALESPLPVEPAFDVRARRAQVHRLLDDRAAWIAEVDAIDALAEQQPSLRVRAALLRAELESSRGNYLEALSFAGAAASAGGDEAVQARARLERGRALLHLGRVDDARAELEEAAAGAPEGDPDLASEIHRALYACALEKNDLADAQKHNEIARAADEARGDRYGLVVARMNDGTIRRRAGDVRAAVEHLGAAVARARELGLVSLERSALLSLASAHNLLGEYDRAAELAEQGIELAKEPEDPLLECRFANALAAFEYSLGNLGHSIARSTHAIEVAVRIHAASWSAFFRYGLAHTFLELGAHEEARAVLDDARRTVEELHIEGQHVVLETHLGHAEVCASKPTQAAARVKRALESGAPPSLDADYTFAILALAQLESGLPADALATLARHSFRPLHRSRALAVSIDAKRALGRDVVEELAEASSLLDDPRLTPIESLELRRSLVRAFDAAGRRDEARVHVSGAAALVERIAKSLGDRAPIVAAFRAHNRDFATARADRV